MADFSALKTAIQTYIKQNGNEEITGAILQEILLSVVTTLGDSAINDLVTALGNEVTARQQADGTLQQNITNEATARGNADTALSNRLGSTITAENTAAAQIGAEAEARAAADTALQGLIDGITDSIENGYVYAGIATPSSTPTTGKVFYLALTAGTYTNFGSTVVSQGINILKYNGSAWSLDAFIGIDDTPTPNSQKLVKSGGAFDSVMTNGSAFDISAHFASGGTLATYVDLSAALAALDTLSAFYKRGGMSIKFVQSSDNKYVQARCMAQSFTTDVTQWQVVTESGSDFDNPDSAKRAKIPTVGAVADVFGKYIEDSEFIWLLTDNEERILFGFRKSDGHAIFGAGVPPQIVNYINNKVKGYDDIVSFLNDIQQGDKTLQELLNTKVDKEEGKSLIDAEYASSQSVIEDSEFIQLEADAEDVILSGRKKDGTKVEFFPLVIQGPKLEVIKGNGYIWAVATKDEGILFGIKTNGRSILDLTDMISDYSKFPIEIWNKVGKKWIVLGYGCNGARKEHCITIGFNNLTNNIGTKNIVIGEDAMQECSGSDNTAVGYHASFRNTSGYQNASFGSESQDDNTAGYGNASIGFCSLQRNNTGNFNVAVGYFALQANYDIRFDPENLKSLNRNTALGARALMNALTGTNDNIAIGYNTLSAAKVYTNNIAIGNEVDCDKDNQTIIGNNDTEETIIRGDLIVKGTDGIKRQIIFNQDGTCSWELIQ